jgi:hypothetical protein
MGRKKKFQSTKFFTAESLVSDSGKSIETLYDEYVNIFNRNTLEFCHHYLCGGSALYTIRTKGFELKRGE